MKQPIPSDRHYEAALDEILHKRLDKAMLARAIQDAHGKEEETKALYIRYRSKQLAEFDQREQEMAKRELEEQAERESRARLLRKDEFYRRYPVMMRVSEAIREDCYKRYLAGEDISPNVLLFDRKNKLISLVLIGILVFLGAIAVFLS